ncbi:MAG: peptide chain release factor N(5)-glutamine methyltransferase [Fibrobacteres bacterium]|nr:peptide chain release factor N(5)-glutamine methyltransferase [Fibrobacterota bacterium]
MTDLSGFDAAAEARLSELQSFWSPAPDMPEETAETVLKALWLAAAGSPASAVRAATLPLPPLDDAAQARLSALFERKRAGEPLAHLTGRQDFLGLELLAGPEALIARKETEILARAALGKLKAMAGRELLVLEPCTGSGNVALAIAAGEPRARIFASDLSPEAVGLARRNLEVTGAGRGGDGTGLRVEFRVGDLLSPFEEERFQGSADLVACNPPYISSAKVPDLPNAIAREPSMAFDGGPFGVSILMKLIKQAPRFLKPGGWLCFEAGLGQGEPMAKQLRRSSDYDLVETACDEAGAVRALMARRSA